MEFIFYIVKSAASSCSSFLFFHVCSCGLVSVSPEHKDQHQAVSGVLSSVDRPGGAGWW